MQERRLNSENDIYLDESTGQVARCVTPFQSVSQAIRTRLQTFRGECFTNTSWGVPWFQDVLGRETLATDYAQEELREIIATVPGVRAVEAVRVTIDGRNISIDYNVTLADGSRIAGRI